MFTQVKKYILAIGLIVAWGSAFSQATVSPDPPSKVNACGGLSNGSISFTVTAGTAPLSLFYFGVGFGQSGVVPLTVGVPVTIPGLQADNYLLSISDGDLVNANYSTFVSISNIAAVTAVLGSKTNSSSCSVPDGSITVNASSGTGTYSYAWFSNNGSGPFPSSPTINGLHGGDYTVIVSDAGSNCTATVGPITLTDPSPIVQNVSTTSPESLCISDAATISLTSSQVLTLPLSYYEIYKNNNPTGVRVNGSGGALTLTLPAGTFVNGDVLTVMAVDDLCLPTLMNGSVTLSVHSPPTSATLSGNANICSGQSTNLSVAVVGGTSPYSFTITGVGPVVGYVSGAPISVSPGATITYTLAGLVTDANGCTVAGSGSATVNVTTAPTAVITSSPGAICAGQGSSTLTFTLTGTGPTYNVSYSDGSTTFNLAGISTGHTVSVSPAATTTYTITSITDLGTSCTGIPGSATTVTVNTPPTAANINLIGANPICAGQTTFINVVVTGGTGPYSFTIPGVPPQVGYVSGTAVGISPAVTTPLILAGVTVTDSKGCTVIGSGGVLVVVRPLPTAVVTASPGAICAGSGTSTLTFTMTGSPPFDVQYTNGVSTFSFSTASLIHTVSVSPAATTNYAITSISDVNPCVGVPGSNATVTVNTPPSNATISGTASICAGTPTNLNVVITGGVSPYTVTINNGVPVQNNYLSGTAIAVSPAATTTYNVVSVLDANGCPAQVLSGSAVVTVNPGPTSAVLSGTSTTCGGPTNLVVTITGGTAPYTFTINNGVGLQSGYISGTAISVTPAATTTYAIAGNVTDANGCFVAGSGSATVTVNNPPSNATLGGTNSICTGASTDLSVSIVGGVGPYTVTINNGVPVQNNYVSGTAIPVTPALTTTYSLVSVVDANGCPAQALAGSAIVTVNNGPISAVLSGTATTCGGPANLMVTITGGTGPYSFTINNGVGLQSGYVSGTAISVSPLATTTYSIAGNVTDANGCSVAGSGSAVVTVNTPATNATINGTTTICTASSTNLSVVITGGTAPYTVTINNGVPVQNNYLSGTAIAVSPASTTTYTLVSVIDANGCPAQALTGPAIVTVNTGPSSAVLSGTATTCGGPTNLVVTVTGGTGPYSFTIDNGVGLQSGYVSGSPISVSPAATTTYNIVGSVMDAGGCTVAGSGSATITVNPVANAVISGNSSICVGQPATVTVTFTSGAAPWDIVYSDGAANTPVTNILANPFILTVSPNPILTTTYSLVSVSNVCGPGTVSGTATVTVNPIAGNQATFGVDTWLGYVYDDAGDVTPLPGRINYSNSKYRGVIDETDIAAMSGSSSYNSATDAFDLDIQDNPSGFTIHSSNVCGTYNDSFSIRYRMRKTFAAGVYTFTVGSDDGVRLLLDGVNIIPAAFVNQTYTTYTSPVQCIAAGSHDLVIEYYEDAGPSRLTFDYQAAPSPTVSTPVTSCVNTAIPVLTASSADPAVTGFNWYKDVTLTTLLFSGANFTPLAADLDMTVAGTTSFFVTAVYACGETLAAQVDVDVVNSAVITPPASPTQICQSSGIVDLNTLVSALPAGGSFTFSGVGVTTSPNFDPTLVAGTTTITADYATGSCLASINFTIDVVSVAVITVPASPVPTCQSAGLIDMTALVSATPAGGTFTFTGPGVTGNNFDPSAQNGPVSITVDYNAGGCTDSKTLAFDVSTSATITPGAASVCPGGGLVNLSLFVSAVPAGGVFTFTGPNVAGNMFDPSSHAGSAVTITVDYAVGGCSAPSASLIVNVRTVTDPLCGTTVNCAVFTVTVTDTRPSCTNQNDGIININVTGGVPNYIVTLTDGASFNQALVGPGPLFTFTNLSPANYFYTLQDGGGNVCTLPHTLPITSTIQANASNFVDAQCFNQPVGGATITVTSGGAAPFEYSTDGGSIWTVFTSPATINNLMPAGAPYSILVRDDATDLCPAQVMVTINNAVADIDAPLGPSPATCANNDGSVQVGIITGGTPPYSYAMDGVNFAALPPNNTFTGLSGGTHTFTVIDATSCSKDFPVLITFPGLVNFTTTVVNPDCLGNGGNGQLVVTITSIGSFQVGISTDPVTPPSSFQSIVSAGNSTVSFLNLSQGIYYVTAQSLGAQCPTVTPSAISAGPVAIDFTAQAANIICFEDGGGVDLTSISGAAGVDYAYQIVNSTGVVQTGAITAIQAVSPVLLSGLAAGDYQIQLSQDQSAATGCATPIASLFKPFTIIGPSAPLDTLSVVKSIVPPEVGLVSILVTVKESGAEPYELRLELITPEFPSPPYLLDYTELSRNANSRMIEFTGARLYPGEYKLSLRDALGCEKEFTLNLENSNVDIPNIFTPNGDGVNDVFYIRNKPSATHVVITNRWGKEVYQSGNYQNDWTGGNSDDGIYYYQVIAGGKTFKGWLEIQRGAGNP